MAESESLSSFANPFMFQNETFANYNLSSGDNYFSTMTNKVEKENKLYEVPLGIVVMLSTLYGGISLTAVAGNGLVLWVVAVSRRMRTVTNMLIANLALADIIIGLFAIPFQFQAALLQRWNLPEFLCAFCPFIQVLSVNVSVFTLASIAMDRYKAVLHPLCARVSKRKAYFILAFIWTLSFTIAFPMELDFRVILREERRNGVLVQKPFCESDLLSDSFRKTYLLTLVLLQYFFPLIILSGAYLRMALQLKGSSVPGNAEDIRDRTILKNKRRAIKMLAVVVLVFALCWLPLQTYNFFQSFIPAINNYEYINIIWFSFHWLAMSNSCCNPFIYAIYNDKFQREFRSRLQFMTFCKEKKSNSPPSEISECARSKRLITLNRYRNESRKMSNFETSRGKSCRDKSPLNCGSEGGRTNPANLRLNKLEVNDDEQRSGILKINNTSNKSLSITYHQTSTDTAQITPSNVICNWKNSTQEITLTIQTEIHTNPL